MRLSNTVLQALRGGVVTGGVACALTVGCGASAPHSETTPRAEQTTSETQSPATQSPATQSPATQSPATQTQTATTNQNAPTTTPVATNTVPETTPVQVSPDNTPIVPEYSTAIACGRG